MPSGHVDEMLSFATVVQAGSIAAAARKVGQPPSTLSRRLTALERRLGVKLLDRTTRSLNLTEAGESYYLHCARIAQEVAEADALVQSHGRAPLGTLRLSAPPVLGAVALSEPLAEYAAKYPAVRIQVTLSERVVDLRKESFDLAIRAGKPPAEGAFVMRPLGSSTPMLCASPEYLRRRGTPRAVSDLRDHALIAQATAGTSAAPLWPFLERDGQEAALSVQPHVSANNLSIAHELCRKGVGIALLPGFLAMDDLRAGALAEVRLGATLAPTRIFAIMPEASAATPKVRAFVNLLARYVAAKRPWT